jgi:hypothetical protein
MSITEAEESEEEVEASMSLLGRCGAVGSLFQNLGRDFTH